MCRPLLPQDMGVKTGTGYQRRNAAEKVEKSGEKMKKVLDKTGSVWYYSGALLRAQSTADVSQKDLEKVLDKQMKQC